MRAKTLCVAVLAALFGLVTAGMVTGVHAEGEKLEIFPLSRVKRGQVGYGLTTIQGTVPERFEFEVIGVNKNFLPKMDIILVKSDDPKLAVSGFWQGMSGSPLFIEGKLACAFSYGFRFNKLAIGGCTPIDYMRQEGFAPARNIKNIPTRPGIPLAAGGRRRIAPHSAASMKEWLALAPGGRVSAAMETLGPPRQPWLMNAPLPAPPAALADGERGMSPAAVPLALSGFSAPAFAEAKKAMERFPLEPMQAGGTGSPSAGPSSFSPGSAIAVQLIRGDMSAAATGTVSFVEGNGVLAFGHPMFHAGEIYAPVAAAEIHTVIPSAMSAFIVASPLRELGALVQDRQSTIAADTSLEVKMIPLRLRIRAGEDAKAKAETFSVEILDNKFFTPTFATIATMNSMSLYLPDREDITVKIHSTIAIRGHEPLRFTDYLYSSTGATGAVAGARGLRALVPLLLNPFSPVHIDGIDLDIEAVYDTNFGDISAIRLPTAELRPGTRSYVDVELQRFGLPPLTERVPFDVPLSLAGSIVKLEVASGDSVSLDAAPPANLEELLVALSKLLPGTVYAVTLYTAEEGAAIRGKLIKDLPASALDRLHTASSNTEMSTYRPIARSTSPAKMVLNGSMSLLVKVADERD